jgi:hypothetical protein
MGTLNSGEYYIISIGNSIGQGCNARTIAVGEI